MVKIGPFVGKDERISPVVEIGPFVGIGLFGGTGPVVSLTYMQVMMTCMGAQRSSKFSQIRPTTAELAALERLKNPHRLIMGKMVLPLFLSYSLSDPFHTCR